MCAQVPCISEWHFCRSCNLFRLKCWRLNENDFKFINITNARMIVTCTTVHIVYIIILFSGYIIGHLEQRCASNRLPAIRQCDFFIDLNHRQLWHLAFCKRSVEEHVCLWIEDFSLKIWVFIRELGTPNDARPPKHTFVTAANYSVPPGPLFDIIMLIPKRQQHVWHNIFR